MTSFFLSLLARSYLSITPGSANLEILIKKNTWLNFCLNEECPKLLCGLDIGHRSGAVEIPCPTCPTWSHFIQESGHSRQVENFYLLVLGQVQMY